MLFWWLRMLTAFFFNFLQAIFSEECPLFFFLSIMQQRYYSTIISDKTLWSVSCIFSGFYHAAMMKTIHVSETESFWEVAVKCTTKYNEAIKAKKHFMDMGDLNALMVQGLRFPNLTPSGSLRSTLLSLTAEPLYQDLGPSAMHLNLTDHLVCTSNHGIGSCLAIFYFIRDAKLEFSFIYASPLFTRPKMQDLVNSILSYLTVE